MGLVELPHRVFMWLMGNGVAILRFSVLVKRPKDGVLLAMYGLRQKQMVLRAKVTDSVPIHVNLPNY